MPNPTNPLAAYAASMPAQDANDDKRSVASLLSPTLSCTNTVPAANASTFAQQAPPSAVAADDPRTRAEMRLGPCHDLLAKLGVESYADGRRPFVLGPTATSGDPLMVLAHEAPKWFFQASPWALAAASGSCRRLKDFIIDGDERLDSSCSCSRATRRRREGCERLCRGCWGGLDDLIDDTTTQPTAALLNLKEPHVAVRSRAAEARHLSPLAAGRGHHLAAQLLAPKHPANARNHATRGRKAAGHKRKSVAARRHRNRCV